jgi:TRAP-type transport system small permease protein
MGRAVRIARWALRAAAAMFLVGLAAVTLLDVLGRYVFHFPVRGAVELIEALMVGTIFTGIVLATIAHQHVTVDLFALRLGRRGRRIQLAFSLVLAAAVSALLGAVSWSQARSAQEFGDRSTMLGLPMGPQVFFMSAFLFVNAIVYVWQLWRLLRDPPQAHEPVAPLPTGGST